MLETLMPFITILPFGLALFIAALGMTPAVAIVLRPKKPPTTQQSVFTCAAALVGAWAFLNAGTIFFTL